MIATHNPCICAECEKLRKDAARYRWLRDGNAYEPEEQGVRGGKDLDDICDDGIGEKHG